MKTLLVQKMFRLPHLTPVWAVTLLTHSSGQNLLSIQRHPHKVLSPLDSELLVDANPVKAHMCLGPESNHASIRMSQSPCGIIQTLFRPDSLLADSYQRP
jgi:hypothetical protein